MVVLQEPENVLPRLGSFPRSHLQEKVWETENENNPPIKKNHDVNGKLPLNQVKILWKTVGKERGLPSGQFMLTLQAWQNNFFKLNWKLVFYYFKEIKDHLFLVKSPRHGSNLFTKIERGWEDSWVWSWWHTKLHPNLCKSHFLSGATVGEWDV